MMNRLKVLVTGAASGIGRATAIRFAREGYDVCVNDIQSAKLDTLVHELEPGTHLIFNGSFSNEADIARGKELIIKHWGRLDVLVSCAGLSAQSDPIHSTIEDWRKIFDIMVNGCVLITALAAGFMKESGRVIHITSIHGNHAKKGASSYAMAKSAINQFCRAMAVDLADRNILVNAIAPGFVDTPMAVADGKNELESEWFRKNYIDGHHLPLKRAAIPDEIAGVAYFLAGKDASYITGQVITVDGGLTITF